MTGSTGTPTPTTTPTSTPKSPTRAIDAGTSRLDKAAAATAETIRPATGNVLASGTEEVGAPTPAAKSPVSPQTGKGSIGADTGTTSNTPGTGTSPSAALAASTSSPSAATTGAGVTTTAAEISSPSATGTGPAGVGGIAESGRMARGTGDTLRSNVADTPGTDTSSNDAGIKPGSIAAEYQRRSDQVSETAEHLRLTANRAADQFRHQSQRGMNVAHSIVRENPVASAIVALGVGVLLGTLLSQGGRSNSQRRRSF
jgi:ElaB/YqjD/DUF883 family membrane-anchored ribosome-binding protein